MTVEIYIPTPFRHLVGNRVRVLSSGTNIDEILTDLEVQFPGFTDQVCETSGEIASHIGVYVNQVEIDSLDEYFKDQRAFYAGMDDATKGLIDGLNGNSSSGKRILYEIIEF